MFDESPMGDAVLKTCTRCEDAKPIDQFEVTRYASGNSGRAAVCRGCKRAREREHYASGRSKARIRAWNNENKSRIKAAAQQRALEFELEHGVSYGAVKAFKARTIGKGISPNDPTVVALYKWHVAIMDAHKAIAKYRKIASRVCAQLERAAERIRMRIRRKTRGSKAKAVDNAVRAWRHGENSITHNRYASFLGYSADELMAHLSPSKRLSTDDLEHWHIDHIVPCRLFDLSKDDHLKLCWDLRNLRLVPAKVNLAKGGTLPPLDEVDSGYVDDLERLGLRTW